jgi:predicted nucleic acid-binding Zn ribbon protein
MDEEGRLRSVTQRAQAIAKARKPRLLAEAVNQYIAQQVQPRQGAADNITEAWKEIVPQNLAAFCRLAEISRGRVKIVVNSPSYMHQLRLSEAELLRKLQERCGRRDVKSIRFEIGR